MLKNVFFNFKKKISKTQKKRFFYISDEDADAVVFSRHLMTHGMVFWWASKWRTRRCPSQTPVTGQLHQLTILQSMPSLSTTCHCLLCMSSKWGQLTQSATASSVQLSHSTPSLVCLNFIGIVLSSVCLCVTYEFKVRTVNSVGFSIYSPALILYTELGLSEFYWHHTVICLSVCLLRMSSKWGQLTRVASASTVQLLPSTPSSVCLNFICIVLSSVCLSVCLLRMSSKGGQLTRSASASTVQLLHSTPSSVCLNFIGICLSICLRCCALRD